MSDAEDFLGYLFENYKARAFNDGMRFVDNHAQAAATLCACARTYSPSFNGNFTWIADYLARRFAAELRPLFADRKVRFPLESDLPTGTKERVVSEVHEGNREFLDDAFSTEAA